MSVNKPLSLPAGEKALRICESARKDTMGTGFFKPKGPFVRPKNLARRDMNTPLLLQFGMVRLSKNIYPVVHGQKIRKGEI